MSDSRDQEALRSQAVAAILRSNAHHKVVVAGPGTGKTFLFKEISRKTDGDVLAITFINNLANDLKYDIGEHAECCTFHALCKKLIYHLPVPPIDKFAYFPKVSVVLDSDRAILCPDIEKADDAFADYLIDNPAIDFFLERAHYYRAVGHTDGVYQVTRFLSDNPELTPVYGQVLVDEFQDFNQLEVAMIEVLGKASPILIVGDDDQALYDFKRASPKFLRTVARDGSYDVFQLPFCSRCSQVIVSAVNRVISSAKSMGLLTDRVEKPFECFLPGKVEDNARFPKIVYAKCSVHQRRAPYITRYIASEIAGIVSSGYRPEFSPGVWDFVIAGPSHYVRGIEDKLKPEFPNTFGSAFEPSELLPHDGYLELLRDGDSDIGWRAVLNTCSTEALETAVKSSAKMDSPIRQHIPRAIQDDVLITLDILRKLRESGEVDAFEETRLMEVLQQSNINSIYQLLNNEQSGQATITEGYGHTIRISSILGCKGLTANYVFLVGLNEGALPKDNNNPTDYEVCKFVVGLTRARRKCYLVSVGNLFGQWKRESLFANWLDSGSVEELYVDKKYFS